ncbi:MAG: DUF3373 family protein [Bdellovibrionales bacterium]
MNKILIALLALGLTSSAFAQSIEDRVTELEVANQLDVWKFSGRLMNFYDSMSYKTEGSDAETGDQLRQLLFIDMEAKPSDKMTFYGRLSFAKYWNEFSRRDLGATINVTDGSGNNYLADDTYTVGGVGDLSRRYTTISGVQVDKAYVDYSITDNFVFSIGRLPTTEGVPTNYYYGEARMATYPRLSYNSFFDGIGLTWNKNNHAVRFLYTPFNYYFGGSSTSNQSSMDGTKDLSGTKEFYTLMYEFNNSNVSWAENFNVSALYQHTDIPFGDQIVSGQRLWSNIVYGLRNFAVHFEATNIKSSGVNASLSFLQTGTESRGQLYADVPDGTPGATWGELDAVDLAAGGQGTFYDASDEASVSGLGILLAVSKDLKKAV